MYADSALSLVVPLAVIALVLLLRRITLCLFLGIIIAGVMMSSDIWEFVRYVYLRISGVFYEVNSVPNTLENLSAQSEIIIKSNSLYVFGFLLILGMLSQLMAYSGGVGAFVKWARARVKTARGSEFVAFIAGIIIFVDDYFNALTVGQVSKSLNDANGSTRERLAYIIDSTSAPVCVLVPISSWGAYIIGIMEGKSFRDFISTPTQAGEQMIGQGGDGAFFLLAQSVWCNFYAWFALIAVFFTIYWQINLKSMRKHINVGVRDKLESNLQHSHSSIYLLIAPVCFLIVCVSSMLLVSGYMQSGSTNPIVMLQHTQTGFSLFWGGVGAFVLACALSFRHLETDSILPIIKYGIASMLPAIYILVFAWAIGPVINEDMQTGQYLASLTQQTFTTNAGMFLPIALFVIAGFIGFATGTSWGTFAIMLPIGASIAQICGADFMLSMAAVLSGAVYGDHSSPISDTTILSATGAGCATQSHFITQLPYVSFCALCAMVAFGVASISEAVVLGWICGVGMLVGGFYLMSKKCSEKICL